MTRLGLFIGCLLCATAAAALALQPLASWSGEEAGEQFGVAVAMGGDANGDGWADLAVGASANDEAGQSAGKVSIYFGRASPNATPDVVLHGEPQSFFGSAVAWVGDVNGDGFDDLLVGAFRDSEAGADAGKAALFLGGDPMATTPALVLQGPGPGAYFGRAVAAAGDLDGDGYADFAIGAPRTANGNVYLYFGGDPIEGAPRLVLEGLAAGDRFGSAIAGVGNADDLPGDDILVGAPRASVSHAWQGAAYLFSGGASLDSVPDWTALGPAGGDQFGSSVAAAGDANGDGAVDLLIGAPYRNVGNLVDAGAAYLFYGGAFLDATPDFILQGSATEERLGTAVAGCGDMTGSGFAHFAAGAPGSDLGGADAGRLLVSPGGDPPLQGEVIVLQGERPGAHFGHAAGGIGNGPARSFSGDMRSDLCVGAWGDGEGGLAVVYGLPADPAGLASGGGGGGLAAGILVSPNPGRSFEIRLERALAQAAGGEIRILSIEGRTIRSLPFAAGGEGGGGPVVVRWDGRTSRGSRAPAGVYHVTAVAEAGPIASRLIVVD